MLSTINPATGLKIENYDCWNNQQCDAVLKDVACAQKLWAQSDFSDREKAMQRMAKTLDDNKLEYAAVMTQEMGKPITQAIAEIEKCASLCRYYADNASEFLQPREIDIAPNKAKVCYEPTGTIFAIMPWNFPYWQVFRFLCPNLMAGNAGVLSHAPISTGTALMIENIVKKAGFAENVFRALLIDIDLTEAVIAHESISGVTLTGSERAGAAVAALAGKHLKKVVLELGGSDAYVVLKDADIAHAAKQLMTSRMLNTGQVCIAAKRLIVEEAVYEDFVAAFMTHINAWQMGEPMDEKTTMGPMARADLREQLHEQVKRLQDEGATLLCGGEMPQGDGFYYPATVFRDVTSDMLCFSEEMFGPVACIIKARDEAHAILLANQSQYGLAGGVFTKDIARGEYIAQHLLQAGTVTVNDFSGSDPRLPFGGIKRSGFGRELACEGMHEFVNIKTVVVK